jgi:endonuclease NucS-like protein
VRRPLTQSVMWLCTMGVENNMSYYKTIKELVVETCVAEGRFPSYEKLTPLVRQHFPASKWQKTHYAWYKSKIKTGEIQVPGFSAEKSEDGYGDEIETEVEDSMEARVSLERDLHSYLAKRISEIESELSLVENGSEFQTEAGRIDLLARDDNNQLVVIELKAGKAKDNALGQLLG